MTSGRSIVIVLLLTVGVIFLLLGATWKHWHPPQSVWSKEQAAEYTNAWHELKMAATSGVRPGDPNSNPKLAAAQARFDSIKTQLEHARTINDYTGTALIGAAIGLIASSALIYRSNQEKT